MWEDTIPSVQAPDKAGDAAESAELTRLLWVAADQANWPGVLMLWQELSTRVIAEPHAYTAVALALRRMQRFDDSEQLTADALLRYPGDPVLLIDRAWSAHDRGDWEQGAARWRSLQALHPEQSVVPLGLAQCLLELDRPADAEATLGDALIRFPGEPQIQLEWARLAHRRRDWPEAARRWEAVRGLAAEVPDIGPSLIQALRESGRLDEADAVFAAMAPRVKAAPSLLAEYAWTANARGDWPEAVRRWQMLRAAAPHDAVECEQAYAQGAWALRHAGQGDAAAALLREGIACLPHSVELRADSAYAAQDRGDLQAALHLWGEVRGLDPMFPAAYIGAAQVLRELGRAAEADAILAPALRLFPDDIHVLTEHAWNGDRLAAQTGEQDLAIRRWTALRDRFPDDPLGHIRTAETCWDAGRRDEADALAGAVFARFPDDPAAAMLYARTAFSRGRRSEALARWRRTRDTFADDPNVHLGAADAYYDADALDEAELAARDAAARFPADHRFRALFARVASRRGDHAEALRRWAAIRASFPDVAEVYSGSGAALIEAARLAEAETLLTEALQRFPHDYELERQLARTLSLGGEHRRAMPLWEALYRRAADINAIRNDLRDVLWRARLDQADAATPAFEIPAILLEDTVATDRATRDLLMRFESLGDTCEFGILQRRFGAEPLGLLRWASVDPPDLLAALRSRFEGVGTPEQTTIGVTNGAYWLLDTRFNFYFATFTLEKFEPREPFYVDQCQRVRFLRRSMLETLEAGKSILVYKYDPAYSTAQLFELHDAVRSYNQRAMLLGVRLQQPDHPSGSVEVLREGLLAGYIDRFSDVDLSIETWLAICRQAADIYFG